MSGMMTIGEAIAQLQDHLPRGAGSTPKAQRPADLMGDPNCGCRGLGYLRLNVPVGHPLFGKVFKCECQAPRVQAQVMRSLQSQSQLSDADRRLDWDSLWASGQIPHDMQPAHTAIRKTLRRGHGWVYLYGPPGPGKTLLVKTAVAEALRHGQGAVFVLWADMLAHIRAGYGAGDFDERLEQWRTVPLLAIDEYGRANNTEWVREIRNRIFVERHEAAIEKHSITLFTSNYHPEAVDNDDVGWLYDRLRDGRYDVLERKNNMGGIVEVLGASMRPAMSY